MVHPVRYFESSNGVNLIMKQECAGAIESFYRKHPNACRSGAVNKHFLSAPENKRLNGNEY